MFSRSALIPGQYIISWVFSLILAMPKCPTFSACFVSSHNDFGTIKQVPLNIIPLLYVESCQCIK